MSEAATEKKMDTTPGTFAWNELATSDVAGSKEFYSKLFGWTAEDIPGMDYTMFNVGEQSVGGMVDKSAHCDGPPLWVSYIHVADVRASLAKAVELGGKEMMGVTEVPEMGSFAMLEDPQGGKFALWQAANKG